MFLGDKEVVTALQREGKWGDGSGMGRGWGDGSGKAKTMKGEEQGNGEEGRGVR